MQIPTYILLAGLTTLATCATLTASPAATDITNDIYALGDKCDQLTNYITANDDTNTMITESAAEKMMSDLSEQLVNKAGTYSPEDVAMIVPAMQASTPKVIGALSALTAKVCLCSLIISTNSNPASHLQIPSLLSIINLYLL